MDSEGVEISRTPHLGPGLAFYIPQVDIHYGMLLELIPFGTPVQVACKRDAFLKTGGWDSSLDTNCDDIDSWIQVARFGDANFSQSMSCLSYNLAGRIQSEVFLLSKISYKYTNEGKDLRFNKSTARPGYS